MLREQYHENIEREKFLQQVFFQQWSSLKRYCNNHGIQLIGDMPIYVCYDSADVWANTDLFKLDEGKQPSFVAGCRRTISARRDNSGAIRFTDGIA